MDTYTNKDVDLSNEATRNQFIKEYQRLSTPVTVDTTNPITSSTLTGAKNITVPTTPVNTTNIDNLTANGYTAVEQAQSDLTQAEKDLANQTKETPRESAISKFLGLNTALAGKGEETAKLQEEQQLAEKTKIANDINNKMLATSRAYEKQIRETEKNLKGTFGGAVAQDIRKIAKQRDEQLADLSIQKAVALGDIDTANKIVETAIAAKYDPIEAQLTNYEKLISIYGNDMTESEKFEAQNKLNSAKEDLDYKRSKQESAVKEAYSTEQYELASELNKLDPNSPDFETKLNSAISRLQAKKSGASDLFGSLPVSTQSKLINSADEFNSRKEIQKFIATVDAANVLNIIDPNSKNPAEHQAIVYGFAKALDPESVVRGEEYEAVKKYSQGLFNKYKGEINNALNGTGFLSPQAIEDIQNTVKNLYDARLPIYENAYNEKSRIIDNIAGFKVSDKLIEKKTGGYSTKEKQIPIDKTTPLKTGYSGSTSSGIKFTIE